MGIESAEGAGHRITDRAETTTTHIRPAETIEHENVKSATAATDGTTENGTAIEVQDGVTIEETTDEEIATYLMTDVAALVEAGIETTSAVPEKTETSSLRRHGARRPTVLLQRSGNQPQI